MADVREQGLVSLDDGGWEVAEGEPDVRGWDVMTSDQRKIGEVDDLLADPTAMKVRYLTIDLDRNIAGSTDSGQNVRIPIGRARLHEREHKVVLDFPSANLRDFSSAPAQAWREDEKKLTRSAEELRIGKRPVTAGEVEVSKHVETRHVSEPVTLKREEVDVQRRPVTGRAAPDDLRMGAQEVRVPITEEEAVIEKRPVVKEEVVVSKKPVHERDTVEADVREERIDVERHGEVGGRERDPDRDRTR